MTKSPWQRSISFQKTALLLLIIFAAILKSYFGHDLPLSGDEVGVGVLQATGQAIAWRNHVDDAPGIFSIDEIKKYIDYSENYGVKDVLLSLRYAGMHPPFYYIGLHYIIKFLNNSTITQRSVSILFSILSIILAYYLGKITSDESVGLYYALFLTLSPYCLQYSVMVRPYPLLTFLALLSTVQIYLLVENKSLNFNNLNCYLYILTCVIGMYTMYYYACIIFFQLIFVLLSRPKKMKTIITNLSIYSVIIVLYIPWLPFLKDQLDVITGGSNYYFYGRYNILLPILQTIRANFLFFPFQNILPQIDDALIEIVVLAIVSVILLIGYSSLLSKKSSKLFAISLLFYLISRYAGDLILGSRTLTFAKFQYFLAPLFFFIFSYGISKISNRFFTRAFCILLCCFLLIASSISVLRLKTNFDGPTYMKSFGEIISNRIDSDENQDTLIITNTTARRFLLPFVHEIENHVDVAIVAQQDTVSELEKINNIEKYDNIFVADFVVPYQEKPQFSVQDQNLITSFLSRNGLTQMTLLFDNTEGTLVSFSDANNVHPAHPLDATLGDAIRLLGYDATLDDRGPTLDVTLYWQALAPVTEDYMMALQLVSPVAGDTTLRWNYNSWPVHKNYPTSIWRPGGVIVNRHHFRLPEADFSTQTWDVHLILYREETGDRLPVRVDRVAVGDRAILARLRIPGHPPPCPEEGRLTADVRFGEAVVLTHALIVPGQSGSRVALCWKALQPLPADYTVFVHLQNTSGALAATGDGPPMQGAFPTLMWHPGDVILDVHHLTFESGTKDQGGRITIGLYKPEDGSRLPAYIGDVPIPDAAVQVWPNHP